MACSICNSLILRAAPVVWGIKKASHDAFLYLEIIRPREARWWLDDKFDVADLFAVVGQS